MDQVVSRRSLTSKVRVQSQVSLCQICGIVPMGQAIIRACRFCLALLFYHCSILIFIYMLFLPEWQAGEALEASEKSGSMGYKSTFRFYRL